LTCVDKTPDELHDFDALAEEARRFAPPWQVVFVAALGGANGQPPADAQVDQALRNMVDAVRQGRISGFAAYDGAGQPLSFA
jgi:hypothetical protein